jgi:sRNA-binding regulator protein Hfq
MPGNIGAETVYLRNGSVVTGQIIAQNKTIVRLKTAKGIIVYNKNNISRILYDNKGSESSVETAKTTDLQNKVKKKDLPENNVADVRDIKVIKDIDPVIGITPAKDDAKPDGNILPKDPVMAMVMEKSSLIKFSVETVDVISLKQSEEKKDSKVKKIEENPSVNKEEKIPQKNESSKNKTSTGKVFLRSVIFPGWGQIYQGRTATGIAYASSFLMAAGGTAAAYQSYGAKSNAHASALNTAMLTSTSIFPLLNSTLNLPISATDAGLLSLYTFTTLQSARVSKINAARNVNAALGIMGGIYLISLADAGLQFFIHRKGKDAVDRISFFFVPDYTGAAITFRF